MFCTQCGNKLPDDALFCTQCGARLKQEPPQGNPGMMGQGTAAPQGFPVDWNLPKDVEDEEDGKTQMLASPFEYIGSIQSQPMQGNQTAFSQKDQGAWEQAYPPVQNFPVAPRPPMDPKKKKKILIISISVGAAVLAVMMLFVFVLVIKKPSININKYLTVTYAGYDTIGTVMTVIDEERFARDYGNKIGSRMKNKEQLGRYSSRDQFGKEAARLFLANCVSGAPDKTEGLSNGEEIHYVWDCDVAKALSEYGVKLKCKDSSYQVEGLKEAATFDPFEGVELIYDGISPNGYLSVSTENAPDVIRNLAFKPDRDGGLSNGDTVTVEVSAYSADLNEYCIENFGKVPSQTTKTYTVEGLDSYLMTAADVSDSGLALMKAQAEDVYNAKIAQDWGDGETLQSFDYIGNYLLINKDSEDSWDSNNILYLVYRVQVHNYFSNGGRKYDALNSVYWYIGYKDLLTDAEGNLTVDVLNYLLPSGEVSIDSDVEDGWGNRYWEYDGYQTLDALYQDVVMASAANYNHEDNVDEALAGGAVQTGASQPDATQPDSQEPQTDGEEGIIFPDSSVKKLGKDEVKALTDEELRYAINELYARHGYIFKDNKLKEYYEKYDWYDPTVKPGDFSMNLFNETERSNVELLQEERDGR